ncbi:MAG: ABC transporter ATP-binding protein [Chloroflexota bacterium]
MTDTLAIETKDLTKRYDGVTVVDRLNLTIKENEIFGLLGPNGAGKTTTILMLLGLTEPADGTVKVCGFNPTHEPLKVKRITGYLPENVGFYENLTPRENLTFIAELNGISYQEAGSMIGEVLKTVGLEEQAELAVGKFSRGMKQRLGIAEVLIKRPRIAILDEPTSGLDPKGINQLLDIIAALPKMGTTVILSSHQLYQVQRVCHSIGILSRGKMVIEGSLEELSRDTLTGGNFVIEVETEQPTPELTETIGKIDGVIKVDAKENTLLISTKADIRKEISKAIVNNNFPLTEVKIHEFSLDDIYMKYFKEG